MPGAADSLRALRAAGRRRLRNGLAALPLVVRVEIAILAIVIAALLSIHSDYNYFETTGAEPGETWVTFSSRVLFGLLLLAAAALVQIAPRLVQRAGDAHFLAATPLAAEAEVLWRADTLAVAALPPGVVAAGLLLPPLEFGAWGVVGAAVTCWLLWLWAVSQGAAWFALAAPEATRGASPLGRFAGRAAHFLLVPLAGLAYFGARETVARVLDPRGAPSLWGTALAGLGLGLAVRAGLRHRACALVRRQAELRERRWIVEWKRRARAAGRRLARGAAPASARVWWSKDLRILWRTPILRSQWTAALALKAAALAVAVFQAERLPWAFAGLLLLLSDFLLGVAILHLWAREETGWVWAAPSPRRAQWWARVAPPLAASLAASLALALWAASDAGLEVARPLALWTVVSGISLIVAAGNLGISSPPHSALGQNLYALGILCSLLVSAIYPVVGWAVLGLFAAYTTRALVRDPRG